MKFVFGLAAVLQLVGAYSVWFTAKLSNPSPGSWKLMGALGMFLCFSAIACLCVAELAHREDKA